MQKNSINALPVIVGLTSYLAVNHIRTLFETKKTLSVTLAGFEYRSYVKT